MRCWKCGRRAKHVRVKWKKTLCLTCAGVSEQERAAIYAEAHRQRVAAGTVRRQKGALAAPWMDQQKL